MTTDPALIDLLADYASGSSSPGVSLLIAAHLTYSAESRARVAAFEALGGALLADAPPAPMAVNASCAALAALDRSGAGAGPLPPIPDAAARTPASEAVDPADRAHDVPCAKHRNGTAKIAPDAAAMLADGRSMGEAAVFPRPLRSALEESLGRAVGADRAGRIPWRFRLPGLSEHEFKGYGAEHVSLLRARPGVAIPQHTHEGVELTLILTGEMTDGDTVYRAGDVAICTEDDDHHPRITGTETCLCLVVMDGGLRFTGRFSRALNLLAE